MKLRLFPTPSSASTVGTPAIVTTCACASGRRAAAHWADSFVVSKAKS